MCSVSSVSLRRGLGPVLVVVVALLLWIGVTNRWSIRDWTLPDNYGGDALEIYARTQIAAEDAFAPLLSFPAIKRLGAPFEADWTGYPVGDSLTFVVAGLLARWVGPFCAVGLVGALLVAASALSFYLCGRYLCWRKEWAVVGGLLFAFVPYNLRWGLTLSFTQTWTLPPLLLLCGMAARRTPFRHYNRPLTFLAGGIGAWMGVGNPYFVLFGAMAGFGSVVLNRLRRSPSARLQPILTYLACLLVVCVVAHLPTILAAIHTAENSTTHFHRGFAAADIYALKPLDLLVPPAEHRLQLFAGLGRRYAEESVLKGEFFSNYLGIAGLVGLVWLMIEAAWRAAHPTGGSRIPDAALGVLTFGFFAAVGGGNSLLAFAGLDWFRASGRIGIFFGVWALYYLMSRLHRYTTDHPRWFSITLAGAIGMVGWYEETPPSAYAAVRHAFAPALAADRRTAGSLERSLGPAARIYQLPAVPFPEAGSQFGLGDYEHFRPFLSDTSLRFSYGVMRAARTARWARRLASLPPSDMVAALGRAGFSALWLDRRGYADEGAALLASLRALGLRELPTERAPDVVVFRLEPVREPVPPDLDDLLLLDRWDEAVRTTPDHAALYAGAGWFPMEKSAGRAWRWAGNTAILGAIFPERSGNAKLRFGVGSLARGRLELCEGGQVLWAKDLPGGAPTEVLVSLPEIHSPRRLEFRFNGPAVRPSPADARHLGFCLENLRVEP